MSKDLYNISGPKAWVTVKAIASVLSDLTEVDFRNLFKIIIDKFKDKQAIEIIEDILDAVQRFLDTGRKVLNELKHQKLIDKKETRLVKKIKHQDARVKRSRKKRT